MARRLTEAQQKAKLLAMLAKTDNISEACLSAKITRASYRAMVASGDITETELQDARAAYTDRVLTQMNKAGLDGLEKPVVRYGKLVKHDDGTPVIEKQIDLSALRMLGERILAEQQKHTQDAIADGIPALYRVAIDARLLTASELATLKRIAQAVDDRRANRLLAQVDGLDISLTHSIGNNEKPSGDMQSNESDLER